MNNYFIILASGQSKRFNSNKPKQFITYKNKALFEHSLDKAMSSKLFKKIILVVNDKKQIKKKYSKDVVIIKGFPKCQVLFPVDCPIESIASQDIIKRLRI